MDPARAVGAELTAPDGSWTDRDVMLYHLAVGAGADPLDRQELSLTYERDLRVLPTFGVIAGSIPLEQVLAVEGLDFDPRMLLHGEQELEVHAALPVAATVRTRGSIAGIYDKGRDAVVVIESTTSDAEDRPLVTNRYTLFLRGAGGFGGESSAPPAPDAPDRLADLVVETPTLPQQALLYRLCGDRNPLHIDPEVARAAGFERPILHGLCTYGMVLRSVVGAALDGDSDAVRSYRARFSGVVFPGETLVTEVWREGAVLHLRASTVERGAPVLTRAAIEVH
ncbi:MAG: MaoC family dehydratase N-terminal domain-containing protein [Actinobacteria bacterium]|nr:MaoC family dehydratase N-terminal domain-containing protein [Actinomycetota bacterium]